MGSGEELPTNLDDWKNMQFDLKGTAEEGAKKLKGVIEERSKVR